MGKWEKEKRNAKNSTGNQRRACFAFPFWCEHFCPSLCFWGFPFPAPCPLLHLSISSQFPLFLISPFAFSICICVEIFLRFFFFSFSFFERHFDVVPFQVQFGVGFIADTWLKCSRMPDECNCYTTDMAWHDWLIDWLTAWLTSAESLPDGFALGCNTLLDEDHDGSLIAWCGPTVILLYKL